MDLLHSFSVSIPLSFFFIFSILWLSKKYFNKNSVRSASPPPEAGGAWPLIGHLPLLASNPAHLTLSGLASKYGPIFTIKLGVHKTLIVNSSEIAKECFTTSDKAFASRPNILAMKLLTYNSAMFGFCPYNQTWRNARKLATLQLLSNQRLGSLKDVRESEARECSKELYELWRRDKNNSDALLIEMRKWFSEVTLNVILKMIVGKRFTSCYGDEEDGKWKEALKSFFVLSGAFVVSDALPFLRWFDIGGYEKLMKKTAKELDFVAEKWLQEHKDKRLCGEIRSDDDFMDVMLSVLSGSTDEFPDHDADTINKATSLALILAASDTTTVALTWALSLLLNHPTVLEKAKHELDTVVGRDRQANESDLKNLVYLQAIIKETMRLYPPAPLGVPHESMEDCTVRGYHIPAGTRVFVNIYKLQRDPNVWSDPNEFQPERFLGAQKDVDVRGKHFELIPFGSGRRACPGISFALMVVQLTLANLVHGFDVRTSDGKEVDMRESVGMTNLKASPLEVLLTPRLSSHLYC